MQQQLSLFPEELTPIPSSIPKLTPIPSAQATNEFPPTRVTAEQLSEYRKWPITRSSLTKGDLLVCIEGYPQRLEEGKIYTFSGGNPGASLITLSEKSEDWYARRFAKYVPETTQKPLNLTSHEYDHTFTPINATEELAYYAAQPKGKSRSFKRGDKVFCVDGAAAHKEPYAGWVYQVGNVDSTRSTISIGLLSGSFWYAGRFVKYEGPASKTPKEIEIDSDPDIPF